MAKNNASRKEHINPLIEQIIKLIKGKYSDKINNNYLEKRWSEFPFIKDLSPDGYYNKLPKNVIGSTRTDLYIPLNDKHIFVEFELSRTEPFRNIVKYWRWIEDSKYDNAVIIFLHVIFKDKFVSGNHMVVTSKLDDLVKYTSEDLTVFLGKELDKSKLLGKFTYIPIGVERNQVTKNFELIKKELEKII